MIDTQHPEIVEETVPSVTFGVDGLGIRIDGDDLRAVAERLVRSPGGPLCGGQLQWGHRFDVSTDEGRERAADWFVDQLLHLVETAVGCDQVELQAA